MADQNGEGITWTGWTWNVFRGCLRVSPECENCYAEVQAARFCGSGQPYDGLITIGAKGPRWNGNVMFVPHHLLDPVRKTKPERVFVDSMSDLFYEKFTDEQIGAVFGAMALSGHQIAFQVLTKRPQNAIDWFRRVDDLSNLDPLGWCLNALSTAVNEQPERKSKLGDIRLLERKLKEFKGDEWPLRNVHIGVSVGTQKRADALMPLLLKIPASIHFVSYEPALEHVDFGMWMGNFDCHHCGARFWSDSGNIGMDLVCVEFDECTSDEGGGETERYACPHCHGYDQGTGDVGQRSFEDYEGQPKVDWIIVGGESGSRARPFDIRWARSVIVQCELGDAAAFVKQFGEQPVFDGKPLTFEHKKAGVPAEWEPDLRVREFPVEPHAEEA